MILDKKFMKWLSDASLEELSEALKNDIDFLTSSDTWHVEESFWDYHYAIRSEYYKLLEAEKGLCIDKKNKEIY